MEYNLWKSVLLDWVNSTGFLVQNYENLGDTNIDTFFITFKQQIKSTQIKSKNVVEFVRDYYKNFYLKLEENDKVPVSEYVYIYSLFLHFACVLHADTTVQQICNNMVRKTQEMIEKYLDYLFKIGKCERAIVQTAIEEAENCDLNTAHVSPLTRNLQSILSNKSPQTPKSKMLNTWNLENRNLKAQIETERFERGYLEMQLNQCEKKLSKLDDDYKMAMAENNHLKKQIQLLDENDEIARNEQTDIVVKQLRREVSEKEDELVSLTIRWNDAKEDIETLKEKLDYAESQVKTLNMKLLDAFGEAESFKNQLDERELMIDYINSNNKELSDMLKELQISSKKLDFDSSSSYEMLNSTANDLNTSSFCGPEENLANAVVDIRLIDQQKQNMALNESINRLQNELSVIQGEATKLHKILIESNDSGVELSSPNEIFSTVSKKYKDLFEKNKDLSQKSEAYFAEVEELKVALNSHETEKAKLTASLVDAKNQLEQIQSEKRDLIVKHSDEVRHIRSEFEAKLNVIVADLEARVNERDALQLKLDYLQKELDEASDLLTKHKFDIDHLNTQLSYEKTARTSVEKEYTALQDEYSVLKQKQNSLIDTINQLEQIQSENLNLIVKHADEARHIRSEFEAKLNAMAADLEARSNEKDSLQSNLDHLQKELDEASDLLTKHKLDIDHLNTQLSYEKTTRTGVEKEYKTLQDEYSVLKEKQTSLMDTINQLEQIQSENQNLIAKHADEVRHIQNEFEAKLKAMAADLEARLNEKDTLQLKLDHLQKELDGASDLLAKQKLDIDHLNTQLSDEKTARTGVEKEYKTLQDEYSVLKEKQTSLVDAKNQLEQIQSEKQDLIAKHADEVHRIRDQFEAKLNAMIADLEARSNEKDALQSNLDHLRKELDEASDLLTKHKLDIDHLNTQLSDEKTTRTGVEKEYTTLQDEYSVLKQKQTSLVDTITQLEQIQSQNQNLIAKHSDEVHHIRSEFEAKLKAMAADLEARINEKKALQLKLDYLQKELDEASDLLAKHKLDIDDLNTQLKDEKTARTGVEKEYKALQDEYSVLKQKQTSLVDAKNQLEQIQSENQNLIAKHADEVHQIRTEFEAKLNAIATDLEARLNEKDSLQSKLDRLQKELNEASDLLNKHELDIDHLNTQLRDEKTARTGVEKEFKTLQDENSVLKQKQTSLIDTIAQLEQIQSQNQNLIVKHADEARHIQSEFEAKLNAMATDLEARLNEKDSLQLKLDHLRKELDEASDLLAKQKLDIDHLNTQLIDEKTARTGVEKEFKTLQDECSVLKQKQTSLIDTINQLEQIQSENRNLIAKHADEVRHIQTEFEAKLNAMAADLEARLNEKDTLQLKLDHLQKEFDEASDLLAKHKLDMYDLNTQLSDEKTARIGVEKEYTALQDEYSVLKQKQTELIEIMQKNEILKAEIKVKDEQAVTLQTEYQQQIERMSIESSEVEKKKSLAEIEEIRSTFEQKCQKIEEETNAMKSHWKKERESLIQDVKICRAKLMKEREAAEQKEKEYKAMRNAFEEKLEKMKERMKTLYKEEMAKVQEKHEKQLNELITENRRYSDKLVFYDERTKEFSSQIHALNEEKLMLLKEHEIMKSKLRTYEIGSTLNTGSSTTSASKFFENMKRGNFGMEDEEGELFDNTYLDELQRGSGRESLTLEEIQRRNSMVPPHLRSSYMPQFSNNEPKTNENNFKSLDDSMFSTQSEARRGTAYKRPGPPTPSKNGGRLSLGVGDLSRGNILREQNGHNERPSLGGATKAAKKQTPGKFSRIFSTSKLKDEEKENDNYQTAGRSTLHQLQKLFFSTSTPRRRNARHSSLPKFETTGLLGLTNSSVSTIDWKFTADRHRLSNLSRNLFAHTKYASEKMKNIGSTDENMHPVHPDSTPKQANEHCEAKKSTLPRKSTVKKRASILRKKVLRFKTQKEKRIAAYDKRRRISRVEQAVDETYSIGSTATYDITGSGSNATGATYDLDPADTTYESEILNFHAEVNEHQGPIEIIVDNADDEVIFEKLCNAKESKCPFEGDEQTMKMSLAPWANDEKTSTRSVVQGEGEGGICSNLGPQSVHSNLSANSTTRMSSHCARLYWTQQKIPKITTFKAEKKSFDNNSQNSVYSHHSTHSVLMTTVKSLHSNVSIGWNDLPSFIKYYIVAITICFIAVVHYQLNH